MIQAAKYMSSITRNLRCEKSNVTAGALPLHAFNACAAAAEVSKETTWLGRGDDHFAGEYKKAHRGDRNPLRKKRMSVIRASRYGNLPHYFSILTDLTSDGPSW